MLIETFHAGKLLAIYRRFADRGRLLPDGLHYVNSWIAEDLTHCFQVMETTDPSLFEHWIAHWRDLADFQVIPVLTSGAAKEKVLGRA